MTIKTLSAIFAVVILGAASSAAGQTYNTDHKTTLTFSQPVEVPGMVLPAGTYTFQILKMMLDRHVVEIRTADGTKLVTTAVAIPNHRLTATGKTVITFHETPAGTPEAIRGWFYPGLKTGEEFVYPKTRALALAAESNITVLSTADTATVPVEQLQTVPVVAVTPAQTEVPLSTVVEPEPVAAATPPAPRRELPKTASSTPLFALLGLMSLAIAGGLRLFGRRTSSVR
jgi:LPXTG-motif cell wall-anchored protein